jgi:hypothetical protein
MKRAGRRRKGSSLQYAAGLSHLKQFPPDRFEWICNEGSASIELRDKRTGTLAKWPHWAFG